MAKPLGVSEGEAKWKGLDIFVPIVNAQIRSDAFVTPSSEVSVPMSGTFRLLAAISSNASYDVKNLTTNTLIYDIAAADTPYTGTPDSPLASVSVAAYDKIGLALPTGSVYGAIAGYMGSIPKGLSVHVYCNYCTAGTAGSTYHVIQGAKNIYFVWLEMANSLTSGESQCSAKLQTSTGTHIETAHAHGSSQRVPITLKAMALGSNPIVTLGSTEYLDLFLQCGASTGTFWVAGLILYD